MDQLETGKKLLYVDGLNFSNDFGFVTKTWTLNFPVVKIEKFVSAAKKSGWTLVVFIDAGIESAEALAKWRSRREEEVRREYRDVPQGLSVLMGDIFRSLGVTVYYSPFSADNDDCIASHAQRDRADILSNDKDFFRYIDHTYQRYGKFEIDESGLTLKGTYPPKANPNYPAPTPKTFIEPPMMLIYNPSFNSVHHLNYYRRGAPSSLVKLLGNPHCLFAGLRASIYAKMGKTEPVDEELPEWDPATESVVWKKSQVQPSHESDHLLTGDFENLQATCDHFISQIRRDVNRVSEREFSNHLFAVYAIIFELWCNYHDNKVTMLQCFSEVYDLVLYQKDYSEVIPVCKGYVTDGFCKFGAKCFSGAGHVRCPDLVDFNYCRRGELCRYRHGL